MRQLKFHESRLLRKTSFTKWDPKVSKLSTEYYQYIQSKYFINDISIINKYKNILKIVKNAALKIAYLKNSDKKKIFLVKRLLNSLKDLKILKKQNLESCLNLKVEDICKRRLASILVTKKMVKHLRDAIKFIEQGHVSIGVKVVNNPNILVTENLEKYVRWSLGSKIKRKIDEFNEGVDDYENLF